MKTKPKDTKVDVNKQSFKDLRFSQEGSNVAVPEHGLVDTVQRRERRSATEKDEYGNPLAIKGSCEKIVLKVFNSTAVEALKQIDVDYTTLEAYTIEIHGSEEELLNIDIESLQDTEIDLKPALLAPLWITRGRSGSYSGIKLIMESHNVIKGEG